MNNIIKCFNCDLEDFKVTKTTYIDDNEIVWYYCNDCKSTFYSMSEIVPVTCMLVEKELGDRR